MWCYIRHLNHSGRDLSRITKEDKRIASELNYSGIEFPVSQDDYPKIEDRFNISINVFAYDNSVYPVYISNKDYDDHMDLLMIFSENECNTGGCNFIENVIENSKDKIHYVYIKDFNRLMFNKTKHKNKKHFCKHCLQIFPSKIVLNNHKIVCLTINGEQSIKLSNESTSFKIYSRQISIPFKIYADFECILEKVDNVSESYSDNSVAVSGSKKYQNHVPCGFSYKLVSVDDQFSKDIVVYRGKDCVNKFITAILDEHKYCKIIKKNYFNQKLLMSTKDEEIFRLPNKCWICGKLFDENSVRVRDHCHIFGKFRGAAHQDCNINLKISNRVPVIFHNLRGYDSHLIIKEMCNFDVDINVIPNGLEKYVIYC